MHEAQRRRFLLASSALLVAPLASAQQLAKVPRIGFLGAVSAAAYANRVDALRAGMRELGYVEGKNVAFEFRWADGKYEQLPRLAAELVGSKVDVIVTHGTPGAFAAKHATKTIPIVMAVSGDAIVTGLVDSLARPGGNLTGSTYFSPELGAKALELLKEALPRVRHVGALFNPDNPSGGPEIKAAESVAKSLQVEYEKFAVRGPNDFSGAVTAMTMRGIEALTVGQDGMLLANLRAIAELALQKRLPSTGPTGFAEVGGMIGYGVNFLNMFRRASVFIDKILKGAKPSDLPIERATTFELVVNQKTARTLGLTLSPSILLRADRMIE